MRHSPQRTELAKLRIACGVRQKELAVQLNVAANHLSMVERGERQSKSLSERGMALLRAAKSI